MIQSRDPRIPTLVEGLPCGRLLLKVATTDEELRSVFKLRYQVFNEELHEGIPENARIGLDIDDFDKSCDHLMVLDAHTQQVIGTYRLLHGPRRPPSGFYSETEFDIRSLDIDYQITVELGRGCIDPIHRKQTTLMALFWGLHKYLTSHGARYLIGCSSLPLMSANDAEATFEQLKRDNHVSWTPNVHPLAPNTFQGDATQGTPNIPPLANFYVNFGAKVLGRPAYDPIFRCYDLFMFFDLEHLSDWGQEILKRFDRRLASGSNSSAAKSPDL